MSNTRIYVTSFLSILHLSDSEYWSQTSLQNGSIHFIDKMSMLQAWAQQTISLSLPQHKTNQIMYICSSIQQQLQLLISIS